MNQASAEYVLDTEQESERLEKQARIPGYHLQEEFKGVSFLPGQRILDAGCGTGLVARYLIDRFPGVQVEACDFSMIRLRDARKLSTSPSHKKIRYFASSLTNVEAEDNTFDGVTCRFVFEHLSDPARVANEFHRILKVNGKICVVDFDGLIFNLYPRSRRLAEMMDKLQRGLPIDLFVGRKIPNLLYLAGFKDIKWDIQTVRFDARSLLAEREITEERFESSMPILSQILGSEHEAREFSQCYRDEMMQQSAVLFYNKFVVTANK